MNCDTQEEIDYYREKLSAGGDEKAQQWGWLKDRYGVSWQIVPTVLPELIGGDPARSETSIAYLGAHACRLGCAMSLTAAGMHWLLLRASRLDPPRLETGLFLATLGASLAAVVAWVVALQRRFRRPKA